MEEEHQVGHLSLGLLAGLTHRGGEVRGLSVQEPQQQLLENGRTGEVDLLLLLVLRVVPGHEVGLPLLQELGGDKCSVVAGPLVGDGPLTEDHHHGLVLGAHRPALPQLAPDSLAQHVHAVVLGAAVEREPVHLLQHGQDLPHGGVLGVDVGVRPDVAPVLVHRPAPLVRVSHHRLDLLPELLGVAPGWGAQRVGSDVR